MPASRVSDGVLCALFPLLVEKSHCIERRIGFEPLLTHLGVFLSGVGGGGGASNKDQKVDTLVEGGSFRESNGTPAY